MAAEIPNRLREIHEMLRRQSGQEIVAAVIVTHSILHSSFPWLPTAAKYQGQSALLSKELLAYYREVSPRPRSLS